MLLIRRFLKWLIWTAAFTFVALTPSSAPLPPWNLYVLTDGAIENLGLSSTQREILSQTPHPALPNLPQDWYVADACWADATNDGSSEWVLLIWRPWRDWPIQQWSNAPSPIEDYHDDQGRSCHVVLIEAASGNEIWAGSALPAPLLSLDVGDVDGDGRNELVTLSGEYSAGPLGAATHLDVWRWNDFGFWLEASVPTPGFHQAWLTDDTDDGILDIVVR